MRMAEPRCQTIAPWFSQMKAPLGPSGVSRTQIMGRHPGMSSPRPSASISFTAINIGSSEVLEVLEGLTETTRPLAHATVKVLVCVEFDEFLLHRLTLRMTRSTVWVDILVLTAAVTDTKRVTCCDTAQIHERH
jgi:hypothetical protein